MKYWRQALKILIPLWAAALILLALTGCPAWLVTGPVQVHEGERFVPPGEYVQWWAEVEACSGLHGNIGRVKWYVVKGRDSFWNDGVEVWGLWSQKDHSIYLAEGQMMEAWVVKHEMLHELIGRPGHPYVPFQNPCGLMARPIPTP